MKDKESMKWKKFCTEERGDLYEPASVIN